MLAGSVGSAAVDGGTATAKNDATPKNRYNEENNFIAYLFIFYMEYICTKTSLENWRKKRGHFISALQVKKEERMDKKS
jgi:hypothetical protein